MPDDIRARPFGFSPNNIVFLDVETLITFLITLCFLCALCIFYVSYTPGCLTQRSNGKSSVSEKMLCIANCMRTFSEMERKKNMSDRNLCRVVIQCLRRVKYCLWFIVGDGHGGCITERSFLPTRDSLSFSTLYFTLV